jgi:hypothetical protein
MAVAVVPEPVTDPVIDPQTGWLDEVLAGLTEGVAACTSQRDTAEVPDAVRIDRVARLEKIKASAATLQMAESVRFAQSEAQAQMNADVHPDKIGRALISSAWHAECLGLRLPVGSRELGRCGLSCPNLSAAGRG